MSANRRQYRQAQRDYKKHACVIDWHKIKAQFKTAAKILPLTVVGLFIGALVINYFGVLSRNKKRQAVLANHATANAIIKEIHNSKNSHYAVFEFFVGNKIYKGQTFYGHSGYAGDIICVMYNTQQPFKNIYCGDANVETFKDDVLMASIKITFAIVGCLIVILPITVLYYLAKGDKQTIAAVTSKKHK